MATTSALMTGEQWLDLPFDGTERCLVRGELREHPTTWRNKRHSRAEARIARFLDEWNDSQPSPRGLIVSGEAGFRLSRDPDTVVGIDVAYVSAEVEERSVTSNLFEGPPVLAVEILSPSDTQERIEERVRLFRDAGVPLVWLVDPALKTVTILQADEPPRMVNATQQIQDLPLLPGLALPVSRIFE